MGEKHPRICAFSMSSSSPLLYISYLSLKLTCKFKRARRFGEMGWRVVWSVQTGVLTSPFTPASCERICFPFASITESLWHFPFGFRETLKELTIPAVTWSPFCKEHMACPLVSLSPWCLGRKESPTPCCFLSPYSALFFFIIPTTLCCNHTLLLVNSLLPCRSSLRAGTWLLWLTAESPVSRTAPDT